MATKMDRKSKDADRVANLYRAAYCVATGSDSLARKFLQKAGLFLESFEIRTPQERNYWAEKIFDEYAKLRYSS